MEQKQKTWGELIDQTNAAHKFVNKLTEVYGIQFTQEQRDQIVGELVVLMDLTRATQPA